MYFTCSILLKCSFRINFISLSISRQTKPPNSEHEAFLVYIIEKNLTSKFYAIMLTHHTVVAIHFRGLFFKFQRVRFLFLWVRTFGGPLLKLFSLSIILVAPSKTWLEHQTQTWNILSFYELLKLPLPFIMTIL